MKIVLFGSNGYIGSEFLHQLKQIKGVEIITFPSRRPDGSQYSYRELSHHIVAVNPYAIINCAAYVGGNSIINCETNKSDTIKSNILFPQMLAEISDACDVILGHLSSGCIYNGFPEGGFKEDDEPNLTFQTKCSFYTGTKALTETLLSETEKKYIWRIRLPFDEINSPRNYLTKIIAFDKLLDCQNSLSNRRELVSACIMCVLDNVPFGTYNVTNPGSINSKEIVKMMKNILNIEKEYQYFESTEQFDKLRGIPTSNVILNTDKLTNVGIKMPNIHDSVEWSLKNFIW